MKAYHAFVAAGLLSFSCGLLADEPATIERFNSLDKDKDGTISINEANGQSQMLREWSDIDQNMNGVLELSEFSAFESSKVDIDDTIAD